MPNKRKTMGRPHHKLKYARNVARVARNKARRKAKKKIHGEPNPNTRTLECLCGKKVKVNKYIERNSYSCSECRTQ